MNPHLVRLIASLVLLPAGVYAQSNVTLYGIADMSVDSMSSGTAKTVRVSSGGSQQSRWGIRGTEDLGGGLQAEFNLESRFTMDDGMLFQGMAFGGRAVVGLSGPWGGVTLGKEYVPLWDIKIRSNPYSVTFWAPTQTITSGEPRANNAVRYRSPRWRGFEFSALVSPGDEDPANRRAGRHADLTLQYSAGNWWWGAGTTNVQRRAGGVRDTTEALAGVRYRWDKVDLFASYWRMATDNVVAADVVANAWSIGASARVTPQGTVRASYTKRNGRKPVANAGDDATHVMFGYEHDLSKRTTLYANYARIVNKGSLNIRLGGFANTGTAGNFSDPRGLQLGIRHTF